ncbi:hypothetical protein [Methanosarcina sp. UBA5]|uniref:hypothetical protein n=1 Tax=Methanosarcina sp. UBA5 TaxID=1915593 RepID=UPI0025CFB6A4|nr:hypothetical protein [Methanosarcina sp. UBA5]
MTEIPGAEKSPDKIGALVYALSMLNLNAYAGSDFNIPVFDAPSSQEIGYSIASQVDLRIYSRITVIED